MEEFLGSTENMDTNDLALLPNTSMSDESMPYQPHNQSGEEVSGEESEEEEEEDDDDQEMVEDDRYNSAGEEVHKRVCVCVVSVSGTMCVGVLHVCCVRKVCAVWVGVLCM